MIAVAGLQKRATLRRKADQKFSEYIRARDKVCQRCGTDEHLQCAHIWPRTYLSIRWDPDNALALCRGCHKFFSHRLADWHAWIIDKIGAHRYSALRRRALKPADTNYETLIRDLERGLEGLRAAAHAGGPR